MVLIKTLTSRNSDILRRLLPLMQSLEQNGNNIMLPKMYYIIIRLSGNLNSMIIYR